MNSETFEKLCEKDESELRRLKLAHEIVNLSDVEQPLSLHGRIKAQLISNSSLITNALIVAFLTFVSTLAIHWIKQSESNRQVAISEFESIAAQFGDYVFSSELVGEWMDNNWTSLREWTPIVTDYNTSITSLRGKELRNRAVISRIWGEARAEQFDRVMGRVKELDRVVHKLNGEISEIVAAENVAEQTKAQSVKVRADRDVAKKVAHEFAKSLPNLTEETERFIESLQSSL